jgi:molybdate transport system substrate-binding protein
MSGLGIATRAVILMSAVLMNVMRAPGVADAAEIKVLSSGALKLALTRLLPEFEKSSRDSVTVAYGPAGAITGRIERGDAADVVIVTMPQLEDLESRGKIVPGSRVGIAGIAIGLAVRKGAPKPDISTVDAFKRALLAARSIAYRDPATGSTSGIYAAGMIDGLGIAPDLRSKIRLVSSEGDHPEDVFRAVAEGDVEMQIGQITEIVIAPGVELVGPLPGEIQQVSVLAAGVVAGSRELRSAQALISFLATPSAAALLQANGFQPVSRD